MSGVNLRRRVPEVDPDSLPPEWPGALRRVLAARGIGQFTSLDHPLTELYPPAGMGDLNTAVLRLARAIRDQERILVAGDFDADGATGAALAVTALRSFGAHQADFIVPSRFSHGYGLTPELVEEARKLDPDLIVTVDSGISSLRGIRAAADAGIEVIVTDHHLPGPELPPAVALVNPNLQDADFPSKALSGVGVVFYLMVALRKQLRSDGVISGPKPALDGLLDLVALGTVADMVALDYNNRVLVQQGIERMRRGRARPGIQALAEVSGRDLARITTADLAFALAPRLNAAGRLDDMGIGIRCLLSEDLDEARQLAGTLDQLNQERKSLQASAQEEAEAVVNGLQLDGELPKALCLFDPGWHQGIVGLVAGRLKERFHRPVAAFAMESDQSSQIKGSVRAIPGLHARDSLAEVDRHAPDLMRRFGGHAGAAGLTMERDGFETFRRLFVEAAERSLSEDHLKQVMWTDGELTGEELCIDLARTLRDAMPWGQGFPEPLFEGRFEVVDRKIVGESHLRMDLRPEQGGPHLSAIAFNAGHRLEDCHGSLLLAYKLSVNYFRGRESLQLMVEHIA